MKNIKNWLTRNNFNFEVIKLNENNAIMVNNDYEGLHATKEVIENYTKINKYINRFQKDFTSKHVGSYTGVLIQPKSIDNTLVQATVKENEINDSLSPEVKENIIEEVKNMENKFPFIIEDGEGNQFTFKDMYSRDTAEYRGNGGTKVVFFNELKYYNVIQETYTEKESNNNCKFISAYYNGYELRKQNNFYILTQYNYNNVIVSGSKKDVVKELKRWSIEVDINNSFMLGMENHFINVLEKEEAENMKELKLHDSELEKIVNDIVISMQDDTITKLELTENNIKCTYISKYQDKKECLLFKSDSKLRLNQVYNKLIDIFNPGQSFDSFTTDEELLKNEISILENRLNNIDSMIQKYLNNNEIRLAYRQIENNVKYTLGAAKEILKGLEVAPAQEVEEMDINKNVKNKILKICDILCHNGNIVVIGDYDLNIGKMYLCSYSNVEICVSYSKGQLIIQTYLPNREHETLSLNTSTIKGIKKLLDFNNIIYTQFSKTKSLNINLYDIQIEEPDQDTIKEEFKEVEKVDPVLAAEGIILNEYYQIHLKNRYETIINFLNDNNIKYEVTQPDTTHLIIKINNISLFLEKGLEKGVLTWGKTSIFKSDLSILDKNLHYLNLDEVITYLKTMINNTSLKVI